MTNRKARGSVQDILGVSYKDNPQEYSRGYRKLYKEHSQLLNRNWKRKNKQRAKDLNVKERDKLKREVFEHYSSGSVRCAVCGYSDIRALSLDHIDNNGASERRRLFGNRMYAGTTFYRWLRKSGYPEGYQILCCNCNWIKKWEYERKIVHNITV